MALSLRPTLIGLVAAACGHAAPPARPVPVPAARAPAPAAAAWTPVPGLGVRVGCAGQAQDLGDEWATVTCGRAVLVLRYEEGATTIDQALVGHEAEEAAYLEASTNHVQRAAHRYRKAYENRGGLGTNYWVDVMIEIGGRVLTCQTGSIGAADTSAAAAAAAGDLCDSIEPRR